jgi:hypothetical protein
MKNWSGYGVTSRKENQPNVEQLNKLRDGFPDWVGVCDQVKGIIELIRREKRDDFLSLWSRTPAEHKVELKDEDYLYVFGSTNYSHNGQDVQKYLMHPDGITATICGERRTFDCFDLEFRRHVGVQWTVLYDPDDLRRVLAVNDDRTLRFILEEKYVQPMALIERKSGDAEELGRVRDFNGLLGRHIVDVRKKSGNLVHELFEEHRELDDTLTKLLIVDSKGQHKDRKNDSRRRSKRIEVNVDDVSPVLSVTEGPIGEENDDIMNIYSRF